MEQKHFLTHVNALRGLAILLVFLYHLREVWCPYGFLGVDAFFVISGFFLIPRILTLHDNRGESPAETTARFNWWKYYRGKLVRIIPPLAAVVLLAMLAAIPFFAPGDLKEAAKTAQSVLSGTVNVHLGEQAVDYFAASVKENLFLHTWYIAVLLQILLIAPLLCVPLSHLRTGWRYSILALLLLSSAVIFFQHWLPGDWQQALPSVLRDGGTLGSVYYQTSGRLWQVLAGGFIGFLPIVDKRALRAVLLIMGLLLLLIPAFWGLIIPDAWGHYDSGFSILAVLGTMLAIRYGANTSASPILENRPLMWLGTVSFSLYLIHWPLLALGRYILFRDFNLWECIGMTVLSLLLAWVMYLLLEKHRRGIIATFILWGLAFACAVTLRSTHGLDGYIHDLRHIRSLDDSHHTYQGWQLAPESAWIAPLPDALTPVHFFYGSGVLRPGDPIYGKKAILTIGDPNQKPNFILLGDSYAEGLFPGMDIVAKEKQWSGLYLNSYITPFWNRSNPQNLNPGLESTRAKAEALLQWLAQNPHLRYILIQQLWDGRFIPAEDWDGNPIPKQQAWAYSEQALREFLGKLKAMGKQIILFMPVPRVNLAQTGLLKNQIQRADMWYMSSANKAKLVGSRSQYDESMGAIRRLMEKLAAEGICTLVDPAPLFFQGEEFNPIRDSHLLIYDYGHLTDYGSSLLIHSLSEQLHAILHRQDQAPESPPQTQEENTPVPTAAPLPTSPSQGFSVTPEVSAP